MSDYTVENHFSVFFVRPQNDAAREHLEEHVSAEALWFGGALAVEPRYISDLATALDADGFTVTL